MEPSEESPVEEYFRTVNKRQKDPTDPVETELKQRPRLSIRTRLSIAFSLIFAICAVIIVWIVFALSELENKLHFLEVADSYLSELQQARRFEKNYLLYGTNLEDALEHLETARQLLHENRAKFIRVWQEQNIQTMEQHLRGYETGLKEFGKAADAEKREEIEAQVRSHGSGMLSFAMELVKKERQAIANTFRLIRSRPLLLLVGLLILIFLVVTLLTRQILNTLSRFMRYTRRIAEGNFQHITPAKKYRDEFTSLALAINHMVDELNRRNEQIVQSEKMASLGTLTSGVAHELNNPLNNISTSVQILLEELEDADLEYKRGLLEETEKEIEKSKNIVKALLEFSRKTDFTRQEVHVKDLIDETIRLIRSEVPSTVEIGIDMPDNVTLEVDPQRIQQVLINLILNGVQAMEDGGVLSIRGWEQDDERVFCFQIRDTGKGIPEDDLPKIFDPFFTTKDVGKGAGLGLSVSHGIIEQHGGRIEVSSRLGEGTRFTVCLPIH